MCITSTATLSRAAAAACRLDQRVDRLLCSVAAPVLYPHRLLLRSVDVHRAHRHAQLLCSRSVVWF